MLPSQQDGLCSFFSTCPNSSCFTFLQVPNGPLGPLAYNANGPLGPLARNASLMTRSHFTSFRPYLPHTPQTTPLKMFFEFSLSSQKINNPSHLLKT